MKKQILFVIMTMCATCAMAVSLPTSSYPVYGVGANDEQSYTVNSGTTFINQAIVGAYNGSCQPNNGDNFGNDCYSCCITEICPDNEDNCLDESNAASSLFLTCMKVCSGEYLGQSPLDAPTAFLLALVAAYGAVAVYRKRMQQA